MPCMCGDTYCSSCGPAQGNSKCPNCGKWSEDGGCDNPEWCKILLDKEDAMRERQYLIEEILGERAKKVKCEIWDLPDDKESWERWEEIPIEELRAERENERPAKTS